MLTAKCWLFLAFLYSIVFIVFHGLGYSYANYVVFSFIALVCVLQLLLNARLSLLSVIVTSLMLAYSSVVLINANSPDGFYYPIIIVLYYFCSFSLVMRLSVDELIRGIICFYVLYFFMSLLVYFFYNNGYRIIYVDKLLISYAFFGLEGSPAYIDYISVVCLYLVLVSTFGNLFKLIVFSISIFSIYASNTATPYLMLMFLFAAFMLEKLSFPRRAFLVLFFIAQFMMFAFSLINEPFSDFLTIVTNRRNIIWEQQLRGFFTDGTIVGILFGDFSKAYVNIPWGGGVTNNPHNAYIFLLLRLGLLFVISFIILLVLRARYLDNRLYLVLVMLLSAGVSNSSLFYVSSPILPMLISYSLFNSTKFARKIIN